MRVRFSLGTPSQTWYSDDYDIALQIAIKKYSFQVGGDEVFTKFIKILRAIAALFMGVVFTIALGLVACLLGLIFKIPCAIFKCPNPANRVINLWSFLVEKTCVQGLLSVKTMIRNKIKCAMDDEVIVCIGNHPSTLGIATFTYFVCLYLGGNILAIAKREHIFNPFIGWPLWFSDSAIFVNRGDSTESKASVGRGIAGLLRVPSTIIIFPDMRRPSGVRIAEDRENFNTKICDVRDWLNYTLVPRSGGLFNLLEDLNGKKVRVVNVTMACDCDDDSVLKLFGIFGARFCVFAEEVNIGGLDRESLNKWLNYEWRRKNEVIDFWKNCKI